MSASKPSSKKPPARSAGPSSKPAAKRAAPKPPGAPASRHPAPAPSRPGPASRGGTSFRIDPSFRDQESRADRGPVDRGRVDRGPADDAPARGSLPRSEPRSGQFPVGGGRQTPAGAYLRQEPPAPPEAWSDEDLETLQALLDEAAENSEPLDVSMLDGFLVGVLLQPKPVALSAWWPWVLDSEEGRAPERGDSQALLSLVQRRYGELRQAISDRQWFDPWVFELDEDASPSETVLPWVAGFALATDVFPGLMGLDESQLTEPLAQLFMHLDPEDLEDADALLEEIESLEPPEELDDAVECLVRASLLLADVSLPRAEPRGGRTGGRPGPQRRGPPHGRR
ncbi:yecA family protein [Roseateles sp. YR242]|uniref:YecA/YgfB family protein n=1 Tax=Roseateles sp. YR242 TaxID=1855305 RepID=UPI0008BCFD40|nr:YecA family protein [Roseateles sp. YR242]SEK83213.1 yecA family protein [Roseateles sp. YR242]